MATTTVPLPLSFTLTTDDAGNVVGVHLGLSAPPPASGSTAITEGQQPKPRPQQKRKESPKMSEACRALALLLRHLLLAEDSVVELLGYDHEDFREIQTMEDADEVCNLLLDQGLRSLLFQLNTFQDLIESNAPVEIVSQVRRELGLACNS